jgi:SRSO17 transposase
VSTVERAFFTKPELALKIDESAGANKLQFGWVRMDSLYGANQKLLKALEDKQLQ